MKTIKINYKFILMLVMVYFSCNSFVLAIKYSIRSRMIMTAVTMGVFAVAIWKGRNRVPNITILLMMLGGMNLLLTSVANGYTNAYMLIVLNYVLVYACIRLYTRQEFFEYYIAVVKLLTVSAIVVGLLNAVVPQLFGGVRRYVSTTGSAYLDLVIVFQASRNRRINSIWGEPGMFAVFLLFALILESFFVDRKLKASHYAIFVTGIILTFSTAGYVCLVLTLITLLLVPNQSRRRMNILVMTIAVMLLSVLFYWTLPWFREQVLSATGKLSSEDISFIGRLGPVVYNLGQGIRSPLWGHGLRGGKFYIDFLSYSGYLVCNTSTTTFLFSSFGIILSGMTVYLTGKFVNADERNSWLVRVMLFIIMILNVNTQAVHLDQIYYLILFSVYMSTPKRQLIEEKK